MGRRVKIANKPSKLIKVTSQPLKRLDHSDVARALGAELVESGVPQGALPTGRVRGNGNDRTDAK